MKKLINDNVVDIPQDVIDLFEKASEGTVTKKKLTNNINIVLESNIGRVGDIIALYYRSYASLAYPLYAVEEPVKYATIAANMQRIYNKKYNEKLDVAVDNSKVVVTTDEYIIEITSDNWSIIDNKEGAPEPVDIDLSEYEDESTYRFFKWCDTELSKENGTTNAFYAYALPGLITACNKKPVIIKWEMAKMLQFAALPETHDIPNRHVVNVDTGEDFIIDCYWAGEREETKGCNVMVVDLRPGADPSKNGLVTRMSDKKYTYDAFLNSSDSGRQKLLKGKERLRPIFNAITCREIDDIDNVTYKGMFNDSYMACQVNNRVYTGRLGAQLSELGIGVELLALDNNKCYIRKDIRKSSGAVRSTVYIYDMDKDILKLCNIQYEKGEVNV